MVITKNHQRFQVPKMEAFLDLNFSAILGVGFPQKKNVSIQLFLVSIYLHFRYLKSLVTEWLFCESLGILAHRTSEDEQRVYNIVQSLPKRKLFRFHETILRR